MDDPKNYGQQKGHDSGGPFATTHPTAQLGDAALKIPSPSSQKLGGPGAIDLRLSGPRSAGERILRCGLSTNRQEDQ
jgi:hypothetical protein